MNDEPSPVLIMNDCLSCLFNAEPDLGDTRDRIDDRSAGTTLREGIPQSRVVLARPRVRPTGLTRIMAQDDVA